MIRAFVPWSLVGLLLVSSMAAAQDAGSLSQQISASNDADQLYQLGLSALAADQADLARQAFERVVGLEPRFAGAWLDLALAAARSGDTAAAVEHLEYLRSQFTLPPALVTQVDYWLGIWNSPSQPSVETAASAPGWQGEVSFGLGRDSNANAGPSRQQIPLSLATGLTFFDIDTAFQPRAASFAQLGVSLGGPAQAIGAGRVSPVVLLRSKRLISDAEFSPLDFQFGLLYQLPLAPDTPGNSWQAHLFAQHYRLGGQALFNGLRLGLQRSAPWQACAANAGGELETRYQQRTPSLGGTLYSASAGMTCPWPGGSRPGSLGATAKVGFEQARFDRPGGGNRSAELAVRYEQPLSATQSLQASWQIAQATDQTGYSPLLESNAVRRIQRQTFNLALRQRLAPGWEARLNVEYFQQRSNLLLFEQQGNAVTLGVAWRFD